VKHCDYFGYLCCGPCEAAETETDVNPCPGGAATLFETWKETDEVGTEIETEMLDDPHTLGEKGGKTVEEGRGHDGGHAYRAICFGRLHVCVVVTPGDEHPCLYPPRRLWLSLRHDIWRAPGAAMEKGTCGGEVETWNPPAHAVVEVMECDGGAVGTWSPPAHAVVGVIEYDVCGGACLALSLLRSRSQKQSPSRNPNPKMCLRMTKMPPTSLAVVP
jgi:hypothetical protein